jgi:hypothetical protein
MVVAVIPVVEMLPMPRPLVVSMAANAEPLLDEMLLLAM